METEPDRTDVSWQRVKLEIADVSSRTSEPRSLTRNYDVIPAGYGDTVVRVETRGGIFADKLVAFPAALATYVRWRDIWDMHWLRSRGAGIDAGLVREKAANYRVEDFEHRLAVAAREAPGLVRSRGLEEALGGFVPPDVAARTLRNDDWLEAVAIETRDMLECLQRDLAPGRNEPVARTAASAGIDAARTVAPCDDDDPFALPNPFKPPRP